MKGKRTLSLVLALTFLVLSLPHTGAFSDMAGHIAERAVERFCAYGYVVGNDDTFRPDDPITRAELAVILDRMASFTNLSSNVYSDLDEGWYTEAVLKLSAAGIMQGYDGLIRPFDNMTRAEAVVLLARTFHLEPEPDGVRFLDDAADIPDWAVGYVGAMASGGFLPFGRTFLAGQDITRAELILILDSLLADVYDEPGVYTDNIHGNLLITAQDVILSDVTVAGNVYLSGQAQNVSLDGATILGEVFSLTNTDAQPENSVIAPDVPDPSPSSDIEAELDLSHTGTETVSVIVRAGQTLTQIAALLEEKSVCAAEEFLAACETIDFSRYYSFLSDAYVSENRVFALEGYLLPDTYTLYLGSSPELVLKTFLDASADIYLAYAERAALLGYTLDEAVTIASIIEKEVGGCTSQDRATVASVIYNRLESGTKLQMNATENYLEACASSWESLSLSEYASYYDTYVCDGLPAGAICSPRAECLEAALTPYETDYLFFRSDRYGNIYYAVTYDEHVQNGELAKNATEYLGYLGNLDDTLEAEEPVIPVDGPYSGYTILLDPGHGGMETGSYTGDCSEKDINLAIALLLRDILRAEGVTVLMTRDNDAYLSAEDRVALTAETSPDLFLSIHCNAYEDDSTVGGIETYYYPGKEDSAAWAELIQDALIASSGASDRGVKQRELLVLHYAEMPAVMAELGFLTNSFECDLLRSDDYQALLAQGLAEGIFAYLDGLSA